MEKLLSTYDGSHIYYQVVGQGEPLLFIHGNSGSSRYFKRQLSFFSKQFKVILMDTRDHGHSSNASDQLTFEQICRDIREILTNEGLKKVSIVGFSDGANIALTYANRYQDSVDKLVLASPNVRFKQLKKAQQWSSHSLFFVTRYLLGLRKKSRVIRLAMKDLPIDKEDYSKLERPVLCFIGDHDIVTPESMKAFISELPHATLDVIKHCGHSIPKLRPTYFNQQTYRFLTQSV